MFSRIVVRTVLVAIITALAGCLWWTWTAEFQNIAQRVALTVIESSVLVAALSLLFESFLSFGTISVKRGSWGYILSGLYMFDEDKTPSITARTCELFGVRSFILSLLSLFTAMILAVAYQGTKALLAFLANPYMPSVNWDETLKIAAQVAITLPSALLLFWGQTLIDKKIGNTAAKVAVSVVYWSVAFGVFMGAMQASSPVDETPVYMAILIAMSVALGLASIVGIIFGLGYLLYKGIGKASQRFPALEHVWNQLCPVQTVRFQ